MAAGDKTSSVVATGVTTTSVSSAVAIPNGQIRPVLTAQIVTVGTATTAAVLVVEVATNGTGGGSGSNWTRMAPRSPEALTAATYSFVIPLPDAITGVRTDFTAQSGGTSSTLGAQIATVSTT